MSVIASYGSSPDWHSVELPAGRSRQACTSYFNRIKDAAMGPKPAKPAIAPVVPKKSRAKANPKKRKVGGKGDAIAEEDNHDDEEPTQSKKQKKEIKEETVQEIKDEEGSEDAVIEDEVIKVEND